MGESSGRDTVAAAPERVQARFDAGLQDMNAQAWSDALREMEALWHDYPEYSGPALNAALIHQRQSRPDLAEQWFQRSLQANQANLDAHNAFAVFLREQGRYEEAREQYQAALAIAPEHADTHFNLGILYDLYLGEKASAVDHFSRYQELTAGESRQVAGWIADLQRQLAQSHSSEGGAS
jgi:Tfp pilus assembly protein PilF